jgi:glycosyltransferase involved in cell wall biosynthesis
MKITVTAASFSSEISGIQRHAFNLVRCLLRRPEISRVDLLVAPWQTKLVQTVGLDRDARLRTHVADMKQGSLSRNSWYYRKLPSLVARLQPDLVHLSYPVPIDAASIHCPTVLTLHDLYPYEIPENFRFPQVLVNRFILKQCLSNVHAIACVSDTTMAGLRTCVPGSAHEKAVRIYNCVEPEPHRIVRSPIPNWSGETFLLCIAQHRRNKNIVLLLEAFHQLSLANVIPPAMKLVVVGIEGPETPRIQQCISDRGLAARVVLLRGLSESELQWCYTRCEAVIVPSKAEGFGLPVAEALLAGCRVLCSDIAPLHEIGGTHCDYVPLNSGGAEGLANAIGKTLQGPRKKPVSLPHLSAEVLGLEYLKFYRQLLSSQGSLRHSGSEARFSMTAPASPSSDPNPSSADVERGGVHGCI